MEELRNYFPLNIVMKGAFDIYQKILGLRFSEVETTNKWHDDVCFYFNFYFYCEF
jgi:Zn-dependent oligopeptidase